MIGIFLFINENDLIRDIYGRVVIVMRDFLVDIINHRFVFTLSSALIIFTAVLRFQDGVDAVDIIILLCVAAACYGIWRALVTHSTVGISSVRAFQDALPNGKRPTIVEFYSPYCAGCLAMKPVVDQLETEAGPRLQVIRLNIDKEPGRTLVPRYGVLFTPTFVYFDKDGNKVRDSVLVLDRARILYELERA
jgi:thioredoxin 1